MSWETGCAPPTSAAASNSTQTPIEMLAGLRQVIRGMDRPFLCGGGYV
jgi:hypothetical protein